MLSQDPQGAIPKGTLLSILLTTVSYLGMAVMSGAVMERDASGNATELYNGTFTDCAYRECKWGLHNSFQVRTYLLLHASVVVFKKFITSHITQFVSHLVLEQISSCVIKFAVGVIDDFYFSYRNRIMHNISLMVVVLRSEYDVFHVLQSF